MLLWFVEASLAKIFFPSASFPQTPSVQSQVLHYTSVSGSHTDWVGGFKFCLKHIKIKFSFQVNGSIILL